MSYIVRRKVGNNRYAYEAMSVWNKDKKTSEQKVIKYLGPVDEKGNIREKIRKPLNILDYGDVMAAKLVLEKSNLPKVISLLPFREKEKQLIELMTLNKVVSPQPDYLLEDWANGNYLSRLYNIPLDSRSISRMLSRIGRKDIPDIYSESLRNVLSPRNIAAYDITTLPTSVDLILSDWGRHGKGKSKIVKLAMLFDVKTRTPLYFRLITGNVQDVSTLSNMIEHVRFSGKPAFCMILDRGFYSSGNIRILKKLLKEKGTDFIVPVPKTTSLFRRYVKSNKGIMKVRNRFLVNEKCTFGTKIKHGFLFIYVFYSPQKSSHDVERINKKLIFGKSKGEEIDRMFGACGYTAVLSSLDQKPGTILRKYYRRYYLEKTYSYLKSKIRLLPVRYHTEETAVAHVFISVLALSLYWSIHERLKEEYSLRHAMLLLRRIKAKIYSADRVFLTEIGKKEREILKMMDVDILPSG